jgi:hypothetical protein
MPGHVKRGGSGDPDPDPLPFLIVSSAEKQRDLAKVKARGISWAVSLPKHFFTFYSNEVA